MKEVYVRQLPTPATLPIFVVLSPLIFPWSEPIVTNFTINWAAGRTGPVWAYGRESTRRVDCTVLGMGF